MHKLDYENSIGKTGADVIHTLNTIADNYMKMNPVENFTLRAESTESFKRDGETGRYIMNLNEKFPGAPMYSYSAIMAKVYVSKPKKPLPMAINCFGPVKVYLNGSLIFESQCFEEVNDQVCTIFPAPFKDGENVFFITARKTPSGFGCIFGAEKDLADPKQYRMPFAEREEMAGWVYSIPSETLHNIPSVNVHEYETNYNWLPKVAWDEEEKRQLQLSRIFGVNKGKIAYGMTSFNATGEVIAKGHCAGNTTFYIDGKSAYECVGSNFEFSISLQAGIHTLTVECESGANDFGYEITLQNALNQKINFIPLYDVKGAKDSWIYSGTFDEKQNIFRLNTISEVIDNKYRCLDMPNVNVRPYIDASRYGKWTYPLGVTLYGLYRAGKMLDREDIKKYAESHITQCVSWYNYSIWDKETYGLPTTDAKLMHMKMLDDCGSCGSTMLEIYKDTKNPEYLKLAEILADFIENKVERREDGALYREQTGVHYLSMWADDLYMSTPFLTRMYEVTGEDKYLRDAANQFLLFKKYLYMEDKRLMSHVYDFKYNTKNYIPWGRGNGWVLFSLTELLQKMPKDYDLREPIEAFFAEFSRGVLDVQGKNGLWHQVLTDENSYEETSCSCMFTYAFSRGVQMGLYDDSAPYIEAVKKAWHALKNYSIDKNGNVYKVCWGSQYSFQPEYYTKKLLTNINDAHGIGIVMLAGIEYNNIKHLMEN